MEYDQQEPEDQIAPGSSSTDGASLSLAGGLSGSGQGGEAAFVGANVSTQAQGETESDILHVF
jgi:hypothetical protein